MILSALFPSIALLVVQAAPTADAVVQPITDVAQSPAAPAANDSALYILFHASPIVQASFFILLALSIVSWAIIFAKWKQFATLKKTNARFWQVFHQAKSLEEIFPHFNPSDGPLFRLFYVAFSGLLGPKKRPGSYERTLRDLDKARSDEVDTLENHLPFLATTASYAPFIGLFGTVCGILAAFWKIGQMGNSSLAVVGPYIAEALVATAVGLAAAIPAVIFYNFFMRKVQKADKEMDFFTQDLALRLKQEYGTQNAS